MNVFEYTEKLRMALMQDKELRDLLGAGEPRNDYLFISKFRTGDRENIEYDPRLLDFIAFYFVGANATNNAYVNKGILRIEIYAKDADDVPAIRERIVTVMHNVFDQRVYAEGWRRASIEGVYKYRLEFMPLIFN